MIELPADLTRKIEWAEHLLRELDNRLREYAATEPVEIEARADDNFVQGLRAWNVWARVRTPPPVELSLLAGDVVQNTRGALDYLAQALVRTADGEPDDRPGGTQFPIMTKPPKRALTIAGCPDATISETVVSLQPYTSDEPHRHPLARLNALNNMNKHQAIPVLTGAGGVPAVIAIHNDDERPLGTVAQFARWFFDGDRLDPIVGLFPPNDTPRAQGQFETVVSLNADAWLTVSMVDELDYYLRHVRDEVIPRFRSFFAEPWPDDVFTVEQPRDPSAALPALDPHRLMAMTQEMFNRAGRGHEDPRLLVMNMVPGISMAMGYHLGGTPLAGPLAPEFGGAPT